MKKNGFTLIELLAVIIILAIVALIATPIVLNVVDSARESAAKSEAPMSFDGINKYCALADMQQQMNGTENICANGVTKEEVASMVNLETASIIDVTYTTGKVTELKVLSNNRTVVYNGTEYTFSTAE